MISRGSKTKVGGQMAKGIEQRRNRRQRYINAIDPFRKRFACSAAEVYGRVMAILSRFDNLEKQLSENADTIAYLKVERDALKAERDTLKVEYAALEAENDTNKLLLAAAHLSEQQNEQQSEQQSEQQ